LLSLDRIKSAITVSLAAVKRRSGPDSKDIKAEEVLKQEAANADLINSKAESIRSDTRLRRFIVYFLCCLIALVCFVIILQTLGVLNLVSGIPAVAAPGGALTVLIGALIWMLRRS
jgi:hypothetical protein